MRASRGSACLRVRVHVELRSWTHSHQVNHRKSPDPNDVERVPEQGEAEQAMLHSRNESEYRHLHHHDDKPDQSECDVQPVATDKREECGEKSAPLRRRADGDHVCEFADLETKKRGSECECDQGTQISPETASRVDGQ